MRTACNRRELALAIAWLFVDETCGAAEPTLRCSIEHGGARQLVETRLTTDPYAARAINLDNRFRFKPVMVGKDGAVDYIKLYSYYIKGKQVMLLHEMKYFPPNLAAGSEIPLGTHYIYAPLYQREMQYSCVLYRSK